MKSSVSHLRGVVNKKARQRKELSFKNSKLRNEIDSLLRSGDRQYSSDSLFLVKNPFQFDLQATPQGQYKFTQRHCSKSVCESVYVRDGLNGLRTVQLYNSARAGKAASVDVATGALAPLVNPAKSRGHFFEQINAETGEIYSFQPDSRTGEIELEFDPVQYRIDKYSLQTEAREILKDIKRVNESGREVFSYRVCDCLRNSQSTTDGVSIVSTKGHDRARFKGLQTCGSIWHCPICSSRISEYRASELRFMLDMWQQSGKGVIFVTNTIRHHFDDDLQLLLDALFGVVWHRYATHRAYKTLRKEIGYLGRVRSVEVTYGKNGWHPHIHEIWLIEKQPTLAELKLIQTKLFKVWNTTLCNAGMLPVTKEHGLTVQNGTNAAEYVAKFGRMPKWDLNSELAKSHLKRGKLNSYTPFDLLKKSLHGDKHARTLFRIYALAFVGRRQLYYSPGLKEFFSLRDIQDEEIALSSSQDIDTLAHLTNLQWRKVLLHGDRAMLLSIAENAGIEGILEYLKNLQ